MRPDWDTYWLEIAHVIAKRGTCARRQVGAVLVNRSYQALATGYNGPARTLPHCTDTPCPGASHPSGQGLEACEAIHAEANALLQCPDVEQIHTCYTTASPCVHCVKLLLNTGCQRIVFAQDYPHSHSRALWEAAGREWVRYEEDSK